MLSEVELLEAIVAAHQEQKRKKRNRYQQKRYLEHKKLITPRAREEKSVLTTWFDLGYHTAIRLPNPLRDWLYSMAPAGAEWARAILAVRCGLLPNPQAQRQVVQQLRSSPDWPSNARQILAEEFERWPPCG